MTGSRLLIVMQEIRGYKLRVLSINLAPRAFPYACILAGILPIANHYGKAFEGSDR